MKRSAIPMVSKTSRVRGKIASALEVCEGLAERSIMRQPAPCRASSLAIVRPTGPAPTTSGTGVSGVMRNHNTPWRGSGRLVLPLNVCCKLVILSRADGEGPRNCTRRFLTQDDARIPIARSLSALRRIGMTMREHQSCHFLGSFCLSVATCSKRSLIFSTRASV